MKVVIALSLLVQATTAPVPSSPSEAGEVTPPRVLYMPPVDRYYPHASLAREEQGMTRLACTLSVVGVLEGCKVAQSSGFPALDDAAFLIARDARYSPLLVAGTATAVPVILPVRWIIGD